MPSFGTTSAVPNPSERSAARRVLSSLKFDDVLNQARTCGFQCVGPTSPPVGTASVSRSYPQLELIALRAAEAERERAAPVAAGLDLAALNFRYRLSGDKPDWRPVRVFDDGRQLFVEFGEAIAVGDMPPLFAIGPKGAAELLNYRVKGRYMIVDRLFERGELRLGAGKTARRVIIERTARAGGGTATGGRTLWTSRSFTGTPPCPTPWARRSTMPKSLQALTSMR